MLIIDFLVKNIYYIYIYYNMEFPVLSGICGSIASYAGRIIIMYIGKIAFQDE